MELIRDYESLYYCNQLTKVEGRRYNIRPEIKDEEEMKPENNGWRCIQKENTAGFFRAWKLNEMHMGITKIVNEMLVAEKTQVNRKIGFNEIELEKLLDECVIMGLLCENKIIFKDEENIQLYMVDTGGIFAFEEAGIHYNKINYTISFNQRLKIYRKNIFLQKNSTKEESVKLYFFEELLEMPQDIKYQGATFLVDMKIAEKLGLTKHVSVALKNIVTQYRAKIFDTGVKEYIDKI